MERNFFLPWMGVKHVTSFNVKIFSVRLSKNNIRVDGARMENVPRIFHNECIAPLAVKWKRKIGVDVISAARIKEWSQIKGKIKTGREKFSNDFNFSSHRIFYTFFFVEWISLSKDTETIARYSSTDGVWEMMFPSRRARCLRIASIIVKFFPFPRLLLPYLPFVIIMILRMCHQFSFLFFPFEFFFFFFWGRINFSSFFDYRNWLFFGFYSAISWYNFCFL